MSKIGKTITFVTVVISLTLIVFPVAAQITQLDSNDCGQFGIKCQGGEDTKSLIDLIQYLVNGLLVLVGMVAAIYLVLGGVRYIHSEGEEGEAEKAKNTILSAVIGIAIIGLSAAIVNFVIYTVSGNSGNEGGSNIGGNGTGQFVRIPRSQPR